MEALEKRLIEHHKRLINDPLLSQLIEKSFEDDGAKEDFEVVFRPRNERELKYAKVVTTVSEDILDMMIRYKKGERFPIPDEENLALQVIVNNLKRVVLDCKDLPELDVTSGVGQARLSFSRLVTNINDKFDYVIKTAGINLNDLTQNRKMSKYLESLVEEKKNKKKNDNLVYGNHFASITDEKLETLVEYADEFHRLYEKYCYKNSINEGLDNFMDFLLGKKK